MTPAHTSAATLAAAAADTASSGSLDWISTFANLGIAGVLLVMLIKGWGIVLARELAAAEKRIEKLEGEKLALEERLRDSTALMIETVVPLMTRAVDVETGLLERMKEEERRGHHDDPGDARPSRPTRR